jgi:hypothetical protein
VRETWLVQEQQEAVDISVANRTLIRELHKFAHSYFPLNTYVCLKSTYHL